MHIQPSVVSCSVLCGRVTPDLVGRCPGKSYFLKVGQCVAFVAMAKDHDWVDVPQKNEQLSQGFLGPGF